MILSGACGRVIVMESKELDFTAVDETHRLIKELVLLGFSGSKVSAGMAYARLYALDNYDSEFLTVARQILTTGSDHAKKIALLNLREIVEPPNNRIAVFDDRARDLRDNLLMKWCAGNVAEAIGHEDVDLLMDNAGHALQTLVEEGHTKYGVDRSAEYWHGLIVLSSIVNPVEPEELAAGIPLILWAGNRSDWAEIIRVGRERNSADPSLIEAILAEEDKIVVSLKNGVL